MRFSPNDVARLVAKNPAQRFDKEKEGDIAVGYDADIALFDPKKQWIIDPADSFSIQTYTPFEGLESGKVQTTFLRGQRV